MVFQICKVKKREKARPWDPESVILFLRWGQKCQNEVKTLEAQAKIISLKNNKFYFLSEVKPGLQSIPSTSSSSGSEPSDEQFEDMLLECKDYQENFENIICNTKDKRKSKEKPASRVEKSAYDKEFPVLLKQGFNQNFMEMTTKAGFFRQREKKYTQFLQFLGKTC